MQQNGLRDTGFSKSLSTGFHRGQVSHEAGLKGASDSNPPDGLNSVTMKQDSSLMRREAIEATLRGKINKLELRLKQVQGEMLRDSRDIVVLKDEALSLHPDKNGKDDKTKAFLFHNLERFVEELQRAYKLQKQTHVYLQQQIDYLKTENVDTTGKILILQKR